MLFFSFLTLKYKGYGTQKEKATCYKQRTLAGAVLVIP